MSKTIYFKIILVLATLGIFLASYLYYNYLTKPLIEVCTISARVNCDAVTKGVLSTLFGIPVSLIGLLGYVTIFISALMKNKKVILGASIFGLIFCLRLTYLEIFSLKIVCPVCLVCQVDMLAVFLLSLVVNRKEE